MWDQVGQTLNQSTVRVLSRLASLLPGMLALIVAVLFSALLAWLVAIVLRRFLLSVRFDEQLERWGFTGIADWSPQQSPRLLVTRVISWSIVLLGFVLGLAAFDATLTSQLAVHLFIYLPNVFAAVIVLALGSIVARYLARNVLIEAVNMNLQYARLLSLGVKWMVMVLTIAMALEHLQIGSGIVHLAFGILFGGIVFALSLAVGLGSKELVSRSLDRESARAAAADAEEPFRHL
ncbi:MAG TPA: hypothetical protein VHB50_01970 [Bryobacteraceae bacterium]|jgi:hypothetical protein|nr:hypothetical protein [Bryobacteraceae bacterium]